MKPLWTVSEAVAATGGRPVGLAEAEIHSVSIDSREIAPGALFVAIRGEKLDGHDYVEQALAQGATAALVSEDWLASHPDVTRVIAVQNPLEGLRGLGRAARARSSAVIVAVTGSAGKTTTKEALRAIFETSGITHSSVKSFNNHWGVPLTLARLPREAAYGVFEIGMNHPGEITPLVRMVRPHYVMITTVAAAHLEFFSSVSEIAVAKAEIFLGLEPGGVAVLNGDHRYLHVLFAKAREAGVDSIVTYGFDAEADYRIGQPEQAGERSFARITHAGVSHDISIAARGRHMIANAAGALAVAELAGVPTALALSALTTFGATEGRGETTALGPADNPLLLIDESYNANMASMQATLEVFSTIVAPSGRKVLVLGDMLELGPQGADLHRSLKSAVQATGATQIFLVGAAMENLREAMGENAIAGHARRIEDLMETILSSLAFGDAVMIKGSKGVRLAQLIDRIKQRFAMSA